MYCIIRAISGLYIAVLDKYGRTGGDAKCHPLTCFALMALACKNLTYKGDELKSMHFTVINPHLGLFGPSKFWNYIQNWTYDHGTYEARVIRSANWSLTMQKKSLSECTISNSIELYVPFHMPYGRPVRHYRLQGYEPKCWASLADPRASQIMVIKYLSVGLIIWLKYQQIALDVLFQMRYDSLLNSNKQSSDSLKAEVTTIFSSNQDCFAYCFAQWWCFGVCRHPSLFWSVTL